MPASLALFAGFNNELRVPAGSFANAAFVGANTVNGPAPESVSASPAAFTAATSVENCGFEAATPTTVCAAGAVVGDAEGAIVAGDVGLAPAESLLADEHAPSRSAAETAAATAMVVRVLGRRVIGGIPPGLRAVARLRTQMSEWINDRQNSFSRSRSLENAWPSEA